MAQPSRPVDLQQQHVPLKVEGEHSDAAGQHLEVPAKQGSSHAATRGQLDTELGGVAAQRREFLPLRTSFTLSR